MHVLNTVIRRSNISSSSHLILGGARSGKSNFALARGLALSDNPVFVATALAGDDEMAQRIAHHRAARGCNWTTIEEPLALAETLSQQPAQAVVVVDCLTLWLSNLLQVERDLDYDLNQAMDTLVQVIADSQSTLILVTNEVGLGLVPEHPLGRVFRDAQGRLNQQVAAVADTVTFIAAGLPLVLKGGSTPLQSG